MMISLQIYPNFSGGDLDEYNWDDDEGEKKDQDVISCNLISVRS